MYRGDGLDDASSSCKYVGIDIGGNGIDCAIGDGGGSGIDALLKLSGKGFTDGLRSNGSGRAPDNTGFRFGDV